MTRARDGVIPVMAAHVALGVCYFLTAQRVLSMRLVAPETQPLTGMIYLSDAMSSTVTWAWTRSRSRSTTSSTKAVNAREGGRRPFPRAALLLPVFDLCGLTCAFEAMRRLGGPLYQTLSGLLIPFSALLSRVILKRRFTTAQLSAIGVVICGLAVKASEVAETSKRNGVEVPAMGLLIANAATVSYGFRGLVMEHLSASKSSLSANAQTMLMGACGFGAFCVYTLATTARDVDGLVWAFYDAQPRDVRDILKVHVGNMLSRAFMVKMMMGVITRAGATQLALSNAIRSVGVIVFSHFIFCPEDSRQCLSREGAVSAAMVVAGGLAYAVCAPKPKTTPTSSTKSDADVAPTVTRRSPTFHDVDDASASTTTTTTPTTTLRRRRSARHG